MEASLIRTRQPGSAAIPPDCRLGEVGFLRLVQHVRETGNRQNPDHLVGRLLGPDAQQAAEQEDLDRLRQMPFFHYLLARTRHYDHCFQDAIQQGIRQVVLFGAGTDTRAYRFRDALEQAGATVLETDLETAIHKKEEQAAALGPSPHVRYRSLDLETDDLAEWLRGAELDPQQRTLFLAEGVSPYLTHAAVRRWLALLGSCAPGGWVAYDYKFSGRLRRLLAPGRSRAPFRLTAKARAITRFHARCGLKTRQATFAKDLQRQHLGYAPEQWFESDGVTILEIGKT